MIVVDASVVVTALPDDGDDGHRVRQRLRGERLVAPQVIDLEVVSAWRRRAAAGRMDGRRVESALADLLALRLERVGHGPLLGRCWELGTTLTVCDAAYVAPPRGSTRRCSPPIGGWPTLRPPLRRRSALLVPPTFGADGIRSTVAHRLGFAVERAGLRGYVRRSWGRGWALGGDAGH